MKRISDRPATGTPVGPGLAGAKRGVTVFGGGDGEADLVAAFSSGEAWLGARGLACLNGRIAGDLFEACSTLSTDPACGLGFEAALALALLAADRRRRRG